MLSRVNGDTAIPARRLRFVVLGGTGFIGRALCAALVYQGHDVVVVSRRARAVQDGVRGTALDLSEASVEEVTALLVAENADVVVNAAGGMWGLTDEQMFDVNVTLVARLVDAVEAAPHRPRLVNLGTVHEYGLVPIGTTMLETMTPAPVMHYAELKLQGTEAVTEAARAGRIDGVTLRIGNVVGPGQPGHSLLGVIAGKLRDAQRAGTPAALTLGPLGSQRDFVGLTDAVSAIIAASTVPELDSRIVNIGRGAATSARAMVDLLISVSGVPVTLEEAPAAAEETVWQRMEIDLAERALGWTPSLGLAEEMKGLWAHNRG